MLGFVVGLVSICAIPVSIRAAFMLNNNRWVNMISIQIKRIYRAALGRNKLKLKLCMNVLGHLCHHCEFVSWSYYCFNRPRNVQ